MPSQIALWPSPYTGLHSLLLHAELCGAGLMWVLNLGFLALDQRALSLTKLMWWMWIAYLAIGIKMTLAHRHSPSILYLQSVYFLTYATMGFLWHCREMHLRSLWLSKLDRVRATPCSQV